MFKEKENFDSVRLPASVFEQLVIAERLGSSARAMISRNLADDVRTILTQHGVEVLGSESRAKEIKSILGKVETRKTVQPQKDHYGVRIICQNSGNRVELGKWIQEAYPLTPDIFEEGVPSIREYADPAVRRLIQGRFNPNISDKYSALHVNIVFRRENSTILDIAEIQIMTPEELEIYNLTRFEYKNGKH